MAQLDNLGKFSILLLAIPWLAFFGILVAQYLKLMKSTLRIQILSTRLSTFLPFYATILFLVVNIPEAYLGLEVAFAVIEAFSFYCATALIVANLGGPDNVIAEMERTKATPYCCGALCPTTAARYYDRLQWALFHFATTRVGFVIASSICGYKHIAAGEIVLSLISFAFVVNAFLTLVLFFEQVYTQSTNLKAVCKIILMKASVALIVLEGLLEEFLFAAHKLNKVQFNNSYPPSENGYRAYGFLVLIEFGLFAVFLFYAYSLTMTVGQGAKAVTNSSTQRGSNLTLTMDSTSGSASNTLLNGEVSNMGFCQYVCEVFALCDTFGQLSPSGESQGVSNL